MAAPDWKPRARVKDPGLMRLLHLRGGVCALEDDTCEPMRLELHHVYPRSQGGDDVEANLIFLCGRHHRAVTFRERETLDALRASLPSGTFQYLSDRLGGPTAASAWLTRYL